MFNLALAEDLNIFDMLTNVAFIFPACTWLLAQIIKFFITALMTKKFVLSRLWGDGGMPSAHSATVTSVAGMCGLSYGFDSAIFALAAIFAIVVMHDATGVRRESGKHAVVIKNVVEVINDYFIERDVEIKTEKLKMLVGHTHLQVLFGALLGVATTVVAYFICA